MKISPGSIYNQKLDAYDNATNFQSGCALYNQNENQMAIATYWNADQLIYKCFIQGIN